MGGQLKIELFPNKSAFGNDLIVQRHKDDAVGIFIECVHIGDVVGNFAVLFGAQAGEVHGFLDAEKSLFLKIAGHQPSHLIGGDVVHGHISSVVIGFGSSHKC